MNDWAPAQIEETRARILRDVSPEALAQGERSRAHRASWGNPMRCKTGAVDIMGECLFCGAINGEACRSPAQVDQGSRPERA